MTFKLYLSAIFFIASTSQGLPYTCVARIEMVLSVIKFSILEGAILKEFSSISANTGVHPSQTIAEVVATYENGVVIISPVLFKALIAICNAVVPLDKKSKCFTSKYS